MKKITTAVAVGLSIAMLAGCTTNGTKKPTKSDATKLVWYAGGEEAQDFDLVMENWNEELSKKHGLEVEMKLIDFGAYSDRMNMIISSGEEYDLCFTSNWSNNFLMNANSGAYTAIDKYLNDENKKLKSVIPDFAWNDAVVGEEIFAVPNYQIMFYQPCLFTPKRLADKNNLDVSTIKKVEDLESYLQKVKENEPDLFPFNPKDYANIHMKLNGYFEIPGVSSLVTKKGDASLKVYSKFELPEYTQILDTLSSYYEKGYIRKDILSSSVETTDGLVYSVFAGSTKPGMGALNEIQYKESIVEMPLGEPYIEPGFAQNTMTAVSSKSKNPKEAVKLLEVLNTDKELFNLLCFGIEGTHYDKVTDKTIKSKENTTYPPLQAWEFGNQFNAYYLDGQEEGIWEQTDEMNKKSEVSLLMGFSVDMKSIKTEIAKTSAVINEYNYLEMGTEKGRNTYNEFITKLKAAGLDTIKAEVEKQIEEFKLKSK